MKNFGEWVVMSLFVLVIAALFIIVITEVCSCGDKHKDELLFNKKYVIVTMGQEEGVTGKLHTPTIWKIVLTRDVEDTTLFMQHRFYTDEVYYNHKVGDTLKFKYIRKDRIFRITRK